MPGAKAIVNDQGGSIDVTIYTAGSRKKLRGLAGIADSEPVAIIAAICSGLLLVIHFTAIFLYNLPLAIASPVSRLATAYVEPYFTQAWNLFAPHSGGPSNSAGFRFSYQNDVGRTRITGWMSASSLFEGVASNPLSRMYLEREIYYASLAFSILEVEQAARKAKAVGLRQKGPIHSISTTNTRTLTRLLGSTAPWFLPPSAHNIRIQLELLQTRQISIGDYFSRHAIIRRARVILPWATVAESSPSLR